MREKLLIGRGLGTAADHPLCGEREEARLMSSGEWPDQLGRDRERKQLTDQSQGAEVWGWICGSGPPSVDTSYYIIRK